MSRIVSVWLKAWPIARLLRSRASAAQADTRERPLVLVAPGKGGARVTALNRAAQRGGVAVGELLSSARSKVLDLKTFDADPAADAAALRKLALWGLRYTPIATAWDDSGGDGLFLDVTGCAHLFGGEAAMLADLAARLRAFGLAPRLAIADTAGASWALAHHGRTDPAIAAPGGQQAALQHLPLAGLRLPGEALALLHRLGFRRIGELIGQPRAPFAARFDGLLLTRLDQALGFAPEPLQSITPPPAYRVQSSFVEPIFTQQHVLEATRRLLVTLAGDLARDGAGARVLRLLLFRVTATASPHDAVLSLDLGLAAPSRDPVHILRLVALRLERLPAGLEADFGFEAAAIHVLAAEPLSERQTQLGIGEAERPDQAPELIRLVDTLRQRLGPQAVHALQPHQSHVPERAVTLSSAVPQAVASGQQQGWTHVSDAVPRPLLLFRHPEPAEVVALIPEGPPRRFLWRGVQHQVAEAQGPERIAPEWWRRTGERERDYYAVEDTSGRRFWLYRAGLYGRGEGPAPTWFVHGVFA